MLISVCDIYLYEFIQFIREEGYNGIGFILLLFMKKNVNVIIKMKYFLLTLLLYYIMKLYIFKNRPGFKMFWLTNA